MRESRANKSCIYEGDINASERAVYTSSAGARACALKQNKTHYHQWDLINPIRALPLREERAFERAAREGEIRGIAGFSGAPNPMFSLALPISSSLSINPFDLAAQLSKFLEGLLSSSRRANRFVFERCARRGAAIPKI